MLSPKAVTPRQAKSRKNSICSALNGKPGSAKKYKGRDHLGRPPPIPATAASPLPPSFMAQCQPTTPQVASYSNNASSASSSNSASHPFGQVDRERAPSRERPPMAGSASATPLHPHRFGFAYPNNHSRQQHPPPGRPTVVQFDDDMMSVGSSSAHTEVWAPPVPRSTLVRFGMTPAPIAPPNMDPPHVLSMEVVQPPQITPPMTPTTPHTNRSRRAGGASQPRQIPSGTSTSTAAMTPRRSPNMLLRDITPAKQCRPRSPEQMTCELALDLLQLRSLDGSIHQLEMAYRAATDHASSSGSSHIRLIESAFQYLYRATRNSNNNGRVMRRSADEMLFGPLHYQHENSSMDI